MLTGGHYIKSRTMHETTDPYAAYWLIMGVDSRWALWSESLDDSVG
jgi:hypothetical protein